MRHTAATRCAEVRSPKRPAVPPKVAGQTYCLQKLERATTTVDVPKTLLKCQSLSDKGSLVGLTPDGGHLTGGTAGPAGRMSACRASVVSTPRSFGSRLPAW